MISIIFYLFILVFTLVCFAAMCVVFLLTAAFDRKRYAMYLMAKGWTRVFFGLLGGRKVAGRENITPGKPYVVIVNHASMLDIPLMYFLPFNFKWVSKKEVYKWPLFGIVLRMLGSITIERGTAGAARKMVKDGTKWLSEGVSVVVFPEGSRSKTGEIGRFREGAFLLAKEAGADILPCVSTGTATAFRGWRFNFRNRYAVTVLPPVPASQIGAEGTQAAAAGIEAAMRVEHEKMRAAQMQSAGKTKNKKNSK